MVRIGSLGNISAPSPFNEPAGETAFQVKGRGVAPSPRERIDSSIDFLGFLINKYLSLVKNKSPITDISDIVVLMRETLKEFQDGIGQIPEDREHLDNAVNLLRAAVDDFFTKKQRPTTWSTNMIANMSSALDELKLIEKP